MTIPAGSGATVSVTGYGSQWYYIRGTEIVGSTNNGGTWETAYTAAAGNYICMRKARSGDDVAWFSRDNGGITKGTNIGLPVELTSFTASTSNGSVTLQWRTATEINNQGFEIEKVRTMLALIRSDLSQVLVLQQNQKATSSRIKQ